MKRRDKYRGATIIPKQKNQEASKKLVEVRKGDEDEPDNMDSDEISNESNPCGVEPD